MHDALPICPRRQAGGSDLVVLFAVDVPADSVRFPLDGVNVKIVAEPLSGRQGERRADAVRAGITGAVNGAMHDRGFAADVLHDVDLATVRPSGGAVAHHPECRPDSLSVGNLDARLEPAIGLRKLATRIDTRGGEAAPGT